MNQLEGLLFTIWLVGAIVGFRIAINLFRDRWTIWKKMLLIIMTAASWVTLLVVFLTILIYFGNETRSSKD